MPKVGEAIAKTKEKFGSLNVEDIHVFFTKEFPKVYSRFMQRKEHWKTTWELERVVALALFEICEEIPESIDYYLCKIDPEPGQLVTVEDLQGIDMDVTAFEIQKYLSSEEGIRLKWEIYAR